MRIEKHPIIEYERGEKVTIYYGDKAVEAYSTETIAAALIAAGISTFSHSIHTHKPMGLFCGIGNCSSCLMRVDGEDNVRICITKCREGMIVEPQR